jgi:hypothetical protein
MLPEGADSNLAKLGFKKLKHFVRSYLNNSLMIKHNHPLLAAFETLQTITVEFPEEPHDYIVASILFHKFSSILEGNIKITQITIDSSIGDNVKYTVNTGNKMLDGNCWWNNNGVETNDVDLFPSWEEVKAENTKFEPRVVLGGKNENRHIW